MGLLWAHKTIHSHSHTHGHAHTHAHADANPLGQGTVKIKVHLLSRVHDIVEEDGLHVAVQATVNHVNVQVSRKPLVEVSLMVAAVVVAANATAAYDLAVVVRSIGQALVLRVRVVVVARMRGGGDVARVLGHAQHARRVRGKGCGGWEVGVGWRAVQVGSFVVVGVQLMAVRTRGQGGGPWRSVVVTLAEVVSVVSEAVR